MVKKSGRNYGRGKAIDAKDDQSLRKKMPGAGLRAFFFVDESMAMAALTSRAVPLRIEAFRP